MRLFAELYHTLGRPGRAILHGRLVVEDEPVDITQARPYSQLTEQEQKRHPILLRVAGREMFVATDDEGYFRHDLCQGTLMPVGEHLVQALSLAPLRVMGEARLRILPPEGRIPVVTSDIDQTYLVTPFESTRGKLSLLRQNAHRREVLPGMPQLYHGLREDLHLQGGALAFLSGSPRFFKRVLEGRMQLDSIKHDALLIKSFKEIAWRELISGSPATISRALREQIGYKLHHLLEHRLSLPPKTPEILLGDDTEADFVTYTLYREIILGRMDPDHQLSQELLRLSVPRLTMLSVVEVARKIKPHVQNHGDIRLIGIRYTPKASPPYDPKPWVERSGAIYHRDTREIALAMMAHGLLTPASVARVIHQCPPDMSR